MQYILVGALAAIGLAAGMLALVAASGSLEVGADTPHAPGVQRAIKFVRERSIARASAGIEVPDKLAEPERQRRGAGNYDAMCVDCHLAPGMPDSEIRRGLYPQPPRLSLPRPAADPARAAARDFWIIKHGIKASGMPAWAKGGMEDEAIWELVAFLQLLPSLSQTAYAQRVAASEGHSHGGLAGQENAAAGHEDEQHPATKPNAAGHDHGSHRHE